MGTGNKTFFDYSIRVFLLQLTALLECFNHLAEEFNNAAKKHCAIKSNLYNGMMTFIRNFLLSNPISAFRSRPVPVFLEFYLATLLFV